MPQINNNFITPFAQGVPMLELGDDAGWLDGMKQYKFMRACYGMVVCTVIGVVVSMFTKPETSERQRGLVWGTIENDPALIESEAARMTRHD